MSEKKPMPKCPYCGWEMQHQFDYPMSYCDVRFYCKHCNAMSPSARGCQTSTESVEKALEEAYEKAMRLYEEPNRVLTLDEVKDAYFNMKKPICCELMWLNKKKIAWIADAAVPWGNVAHIMERQEPKWKDYGKTWRCWLCNPTDEERAATPWEGEKDDDD
jgi:hypothetical protein